MVAVPPHSLSFCPRLTLGEETARLTADSRKLCREFAALNLQWRLACELSRAALSVPVRDLHGPVPDGHGPYYVGSDSCFR